MHPELYLVVHRQQERELEEQLRRRLVMAERATATPATPRRSRRLRLSPVRALPRSGAPPECGPAGPCVTA